MEEKTGVARLRQAITNQAACGSGQFELSIDSADKLCREIEAQLALVLSEPCSAECPASGAHDSCAVTAVRDVMRRAKALAERDAKGADRD